MTHITYYLSTYPRPRLSVINNQPLDVVVHAAISICIHPPPKGGPNKEKGWGADGETKDTNKLGRGGDVGRGRDNWGPGDRQSGPSAELPARVAFSDQSQRSHRMSVEPRAVDHRYSKTQDAGHRRTAHHAQHNLHEHTRISATVTPSPISPIDNLHRVVGQQDVYSAPHPICTHPHLPAPVDKGTALMSSKADHPPEWGSSAPVKPYPVGTSERLAARKARLWAPVASNLRAPTMSWGPPRACAGGSSPSEDADARRTRRPPSLGRPA
eukprot:scaffold15920_cov129-Isochrysis_galbana.AAC.1